MVLHKPSSIYKIFLKHYPSRGEGWGSFEKMRQERAIVAQKRPNFYYQSNNWCSFKLQPDKMCAENVDPGIVFRVQQRFTKLEDVRNENNLTCSCTDLLAAKKHNHNGEQRFQITLSIGNIDHRNCSGLVVGALNSNPYASRLRTNTVPRNF